MNRYFVVDDADMPTDTAPVGEWHSIDLSSHGAAGAGKHVVVLKDDYAQPPATWMAMPKLLDPSTTVTQAGVNTYLTDIGVAASDTMYQASDPLGAIHPMMVH